MHFKIDSEKGFFSLINFNDKFDAKENAAGSFHSLERMRTFIGEKRTWFSLGEFRVCQSHGDDRTMLDNRFRVCLISVLILRNQPETIRCDCLRNEGNGHVSYFRTTGDFTDF